jgi:hypothetical protein
MNPCGNAHLVYDKGAKTWWRKDSLFNKCCWEHWTSAGRKLKLDSCFSLCTSTNSKWIKKLDIRPETLKLLQGRTGNTLELISIGNDSLNRIERAQQWREMIDKFDYMKLESFCTTKEMATRLLMNWLRKYGIYIQWNFI